MSEEDTQERAKGLARLWQGSVVPVEDETSTAARRDRVVGTLSARIRQAAARRHRRRLGNRIGGLVAAAAVMVTIGVVWQVRPSDSTREARVEAAEAAQIGRIHSTAGAALLVRSGQRKALAQGTALELGDGLETAGGAYAEIRLSEKVFVRLAGKGNVALPAPERAAHRLRLARGTITASVEKGPSPRPKLLVETPNVEVVVVGTRFEVEVTHPPPEARPVTRVTVMSGQVEVRRQGDLLTLVSAGEEWVSAEPAPAVLDGEVTVGKVTGSEEEASSAPLPVPSRRATAGTRRPASEPVELGTLAEENQLFQTAVDARNRGDEAVVVDRLGELLSKYPRSPLAHEALLERMRALHRMGRASEAAREARRYLAQHPGGAARAEAQRLVLSEHE